MKVSKEIINKWGNKLIAYYKNTDPFDKNSLIIDTLRLSEPKRLYRVLCSCAYLGMDKYFAGGVLTKDILEETGWKLPNKATSSQIIQDKKQSKQIEQKRRKYISQDMINELCQKTGSILPVEWRMFYVLYVPDTIFTPDELLFMKNNPCWLLSLVNGPLKSTRNY